MPPERAVPPPIRPRCALGQLRGGGRVCYADASDAIHNAHCPEARREARQRAVWGWVRAGVVIAALCAWAAVAVLTVWQRTCGLGAGC